MAAIVVIAVLVVGSGSVFLSLSASGSPMAARGGVRLAAVGGKLVHGRWQAWANAARVPTVTGRVTLRLGGCPAAPKAAGCVYPQRPREVYLRRTARDPRAVLLHELGHVYDLTVLSDRDRLRFRAIMGVPARREWWAGEIPLAEWFAEGYSWCARRARITTIERYAIYSYDPTPRQHKQLCALITTAARDNTPPKPPPAPPSVTRDPAPPFAARQLVPSPVTVASTPVPAPASTRTPTPTPTPTPPQQQPTPVPTTPPIWPTPKITPAPTATAEDTPEPEPTAAPEPTADHAG